MQLLFNRLHSSEILNIFKLKNKKKTGTLMRTISGRNGQVTWNMIMG